MKRWLKVIFLFWLLSSTNVAFADLKPVFNIDVCAWNSNQIVVVDLSSIEKREFKVLEVWKGDLKIGEHLVLPFMHNFINLFNATEPKDRSMGIPLKITEQDCNRMVLFLNKDSTGKLWPSNFNSELYDEGKENQNFVRSLMQISMAWINQDGVYGYLQNSNPGPLEYSKLFEVDYKNKEGWRPENWNYYTESSFKERILGYQNLKIRLYSLRMISDSFERSDSLMSIFKNEVMPNYTAASDELLRMLANCGMAYFETLKRELQRKEIKPMLTLLLWRYAQVGGKHTEPILIKLAKSQFDWWKSKPIVDKPLLLDFKTEVLFYTIYGLAALPYPGCSDCKEMVKDFKTFWLENPQYGKCDEISNACTQVLD